MVPSRCRHRKRTTPRSYTVKIRISKRTVDGLKPADKPYIAYDADLTGFGVRVMPTGSKSYVIEYRSGFGGRGVRSTRLSLGSTKTLTPDEARKLARDKLADARRGDDPAAERSAARKTPPLSKVVEDFLKDAKATKSTTTAKLYSYYAESFVLPHLGTKKITDITRGDVIRMHREIGESAQVTANRIVRFLSGIYRFAETMGTVPELFNPARGVTLFKEHAKERFLSTDELQRLGAALREAETVGIPWEGAGKPGKSKHVPKEAVEIYPRQVTGAIRLLLFTGCRLREILHLRWEQVDMERGFLHLDKSKTGKRTVILNAPALAELACIPRISDYVIAGNDPEKPRADLQRPWTAIRRAAGLEDVRIHDLRHSFASVGAGAGMGLPIVGRLLGHTQASTTQRYAHLDADPVRLAANRIGETIAAALGGNPSAEIVSIKGRKA